MQEQNDNMQQSLLPRAESVNNIGGSDGSGVGPLRLALMERCCKWRGLACICHVTKWYSGQSSQKTCKNHSKMQDVDVLVGVQTLCNNLPPVHLGSCTRGKIEHVSNCTGHCSWLLA